MAEKYGTIISIAKILVVINEEIAAYKFDHAGLVHIRHGCERISDPLSRLGGTRNWRSYADRAVCRRIQQHTHSKRKEIDAE